MEFAPRTPRDQFAIHNSCTYPVFPATRAQRCWVHKTANVLNKLPKHKQATVKEDD